MSKSQDERRDRIRRERERVSKSQDEGSDIRIKRERD